MLNLSKPKQERWSNPPSRIYKKHSPKLLLMTSLFFEKDADSIYEEYQNSIDDSVDSQEEEYREDKMEQMISRHGY